jgi:hypothetical protein
MNAVETLVGADIPMALTEDDRALIIAALQQLIDLSRDELAGRELYQQRKAEGDSPSGDSFASRIQQLQQQIEVWQALLVKLLGIDGS